MGPCPAFDGAWLTEYATMYSGWLLMAGLLAGLGWLGKLAFLS